MLYAFTGGSDGSEPYGNLVADKNGNFYGTTPFGGSNCGCGVVFKVAPDGTETVVHAFQGGADGYEPGGGVILDSNGNLYGTTTAGGGSSSCGTIGCGTLFKIAPDGRETTVYAFQGDNDGSVPSSSLLIDGADNLIGTTGFGGTCQNGGGGCGTVFKVAPDGTETVLYSFKGGSDGDVPEAGVITDKAGSLYGTTYYGGGTHCHGLGCGTVFKLAADGTESVLFAFGNKRGRYPAAGLLRGPHGVLYGTTTAGGTNNDGVVFKIKE